MKKYLLIAVTFLIAIAVASPASALRFDIESPNTWGKSDDPVVALNPGLVRKLDKKLPGSTEDKEFSLTRLSILSHGGFHWPHTLDDMFLSKLREKIDAIRKVIIEIKRLGPGHIKIVPGSDVTPVPEPGTIMLMGIGLVGLASIGRRKFKQ
jgi:hypothetical protein